MKCVNERGQWEEHEQEKRRRGMPTPRPISPKYDPAKPVGVLRRLLNLTRAEKTLGWKPKTKLADGLAKKYEWAERRIATPSCCMSLDEGQRAEGRG